MTQTTVRTATRVPRRVITAIGVGFPVLYLTNGFMPWSTRLFMEDDRAAYIPFWTSAMVLHWATVLVCVLLMRRYGMTAADVRLPMSGRQMLGRLAILLGAGLVIGQVARLVDLPDFFLTDLTQHWEMYPSTAFEYVFWPFMALSAGVCEEFVYRGFLASALERRGMPRHRAMTLATIVWIGVHGLAGVVFFPVYLVAGLIFAAIASRRGRLSDSIVVHVVVDSLAAFR